METAEKNPNPNTQSPIPNPQSPIPISNIYFNLFYKKKILNIIIIHFLFKIKN